MSSRVGGTAGKRTRETQDGLVQVKKSDLEKLSTEVMQLRDFLPRVLNTDLMETLQKAQKDQTATEQLEQNQDRLRQDAIHLQARLDALMSECQREREEKLFLREQLWRSGGELLQQAEFCAGLGSAACVLLWSCSGRQDTVTQWLADGKLSAFLSVAAQTLESFVRSLDDEEKSQTEDHNSQEHQFVLALAGTITNVAAVPCGRDFLAGSAHVLLDTLLKLLELLKPGVFPKLKALMLMALYNVSINVKGLKYMSENQGLLPVIWSLLEDGHWEVCLHSLRLLQSVLLEEDAVRRLASSLRDPDLRDRVGRLAGSTQPGLKAAAQQTLQDLQDLQPARGGTPGSG